MDLIYQSPFLKALGWSLVNSLWQMGVLWLAYLFISANGKRFGAAIRHTLALLFICIGSAWFIADLISNLLTIKQYGYLPGQMTDIQELLGINFLVSSTSGAAPLLSLCYLIALFYLMIRFILDFRFSNRLCHSRLTLPESYLITFMEQAAAKMDLKRKVSIWISPLTDTPLTIGFWKPVVLLPVALLNHLTPSQAEAIIIHELQHIKRNDYLTNLAIAFTDILLFFNPFARMLAEMVRKERENSCDDKVLQWPYEMSQYAQALLLLEKSRSTTSILSMAATGKGKQALLNRVKRMAYGQNYVPPAPGRKLAGCLFIILAAASTGWHRYQVSPAVSLNSSYALPLAFPHLAISDLPARPEKPAANSATGKTIQLSFSENTRPAAKRASSDKKVKSRVKSSPITSFPSITINELNKRQERIRINELLLAAGGQPNLVSYASIPENSFQPGGITYPQTPTGETTTSLPHITSGITYSSEDFFQTVQIRPDILLVISRNGDAIVLKIKEKTNTLDTSSHRPARATHREKAVRKIVHI